MSRAAQVTFSSCRPPPCGTQRPRPATPRVFISYSWTSPDYKERVLHLAGHLVTDGVDVILDRWHLRPGDDAYAFMERAVRDPEVDHVLILCDPMYVARADDREGGVGAETLIISPAVYGEARQTKFIPVLMERDPDGAAVKPVYLSGRIHVDLSIAEREAEEYDRLLRLLHGLPDVVPPPLGRRPAFLDDGHVPLLTGRALGQYQDAARRGRPEQHGYLGAYLDRLTDAIAAEEITDARDPNALLAAVQASIERFLPYRDEFADLVRFLGEFGEGTQPYDRLHRFFERAVNTRYRHRERGMGWGEETENLAFIGRELFLYAVATLLRAERFAGLARLLRPFHVRVEHDTAGALRSVEVLDATFPQLDGERRGSRGALAGLLRRRATLTDLPYQALAEAEFLLAIRATFDVGLVNEWGGVPWWIPRGAGVLWRPTQLPLAARLRDGDYLDRVLLTLGVRDRTVLADRINAAPSDGQAGPEIHRLTAGMLRSIFGLGSPQQG